MPTTLPERPVKMKLPVWLFCWILAFYLASAAIEFLDPAPMDLAAALITSP